jgi:hypothetical protein
MRLLVVAGLLVATATRAQAACDEPAGAHIWWSPEAPIAGQVLRLLAVVEQDGEATLVRGAGKDAEPLATVRRGGPPASFAAEIAKPSAGNLRIELRRGERVLACRTIKVLRRSGERTLRTPGASFWASSRRWDRSTEGYFSAWVESLFDAPPSEPLNFRPLAPALRDPKRNFLYDHLGLSEDDPHNRQAIPAEPDCADLPYFLRAYFSWKMGLPFGFRDCDRGSATAPPRCGVLFTNEEAPATGKGAGKTALAVFRQFLRKLGNTAHSGSARTALADDATDHYPVPLTRAALRPGTIYADPYGHVLVVAKWVPQTATGGGLLLAVDGQPDGSVGRKRFWEGTFLFASDVASAGPGFKAFRPLVREGDAGPLAPLTNAALAHDERFTPVSLEQAGLAQEAFYARLGKVINPSGLDPAAAYEETLSALVEQLETRVGSVLNGETYMRGSPPPPVVEMPEGPKIFETVGAWEDYATPSRDMRLIIAMNVLAGLPERIVRHPELFLLKDRKPEQARAEIVALHARRSQERTIEYKRSDGSAQRLTVADLLARKSALEMAYNPNDCVEARWGAAEGTPEYATCQRHAPPEQRARMEQYRSWFRDARRPSR